MFHLLLSEPHGGSNKPHKRTPAHLTEIMCLHNIRSKKIPAEVLLWQNMNQGNVEPFPHLLNTSNMLDLFVYLSLRNV